MKPLRNISKSLLITALLHITLFAQFDSLIFFHNGLYLGPSYSDIYTLGDQNDDGYDDI